MAREAIDRARLLSQVELFSELDGEAVATVAERTTQAHFQAGRPIVRQGEVGNGLFVVVEGTATVVRDGKPIATVGPGDLVGELSVLDRAPRSANVVAAAPTRCLALASWDLEALVEREPRIALALLRSLARRVRQASGERHLD